jgi:ATP-dependent helicase HrpB
MFDLTINHLPYSPAPLHVQVKSAVELLLNDEPLGHTLVFLPGTVEIRRTMRECETVRTPSRAARAAAAW